MKKLFIIYFLSSLLIPQLLKAGVFEDANKKYQEGQYQEAETLYQSLLNKGLESGNLFYNLGNACYKQDKIAEAILFYEKAKKLEPDDADIDYNLRMANLKVVDKIVPVPEIFYVQWFKRLANSLEADHWAILSVCLSFLFVFLAAGFVRGSAPSAKRFYFFSSLVILIFLLLSFGLAKQQYALIKNHDSAIIFDPNTYVKSSPAEKSTDLFILHEGTKVQVVDELDNWLRIRLPNGNEGWVEQKSLRLI